MAQDFLKKIKLLTIAALVADDMLMAILVLKGGNALGLAYDITNRGSIDIDFSMESDFSAKDRKYLENQLHFLLNDEFNKEHLSVFDIKLIEKPSKIDDSVKSFWGGYFLEFKTISTDKFLALNTDIESLRRNAIPLHKDHSPKFTVDISKHEYIANKRPKDLEGVSVFVYSPEMLALEKLRALCQQNESYKEIVKYMTAKSRARDFYDIYNICESFSIDFTSEENIELCSNIFAAKKVPLEFIGELEHQKDLHKQSWPRVINTVNQRENLKDFDFYFYYVLEKFSIYAKPLG